jgi:glutamate-1-semialdehyde 2,1-aminomutase
MHSENDTLIKEDYLVGGVTSGWNHFRLSGSFQVAKANDAEIWDQKGNRYIDWIMGWGSLILGHRPLPVMEAIKKSFDIGFGFQYETTIHKELAKEICTAIPGAEKVRLANSGSEATLHALRIARHVTKKNKIVKFEGHFHGLNDYLLYGVDCVPELGGYMENGSIAPIAGSDGLPDRQMAELVRILDFNDLEAVENIFEKEGDDIAAVILEPIALNIGCIRPDDGFLQGLRTLCDRFNVLLIFDEVLTGFRVAYGGAQEYYNVIPDLACYGKALGCGVPVAAVAGKKIYMDALTPVGGVQMAGTNTGRLITVAGTLAAVKELKKDGFHDRLTQLNDYFVENSQALLNKYNVPSYVEGYGGRMGIFFGMEERPRNYREIVSQWNEAFHLACYEKTYSKYGLFGFLLPLTTCPEPVTLSICHNQSILDETLSRFEDILKEVPYFE